MEFYIGQLGGATLMLTAIGYIFLYLFQIKRLRPYIATAGIAATLIFTAIFSYATYGDSTNAWLGLSSWIISGAFLYWKARSFSNSPEDSISIRKININKYLMVTIISSVLAVFFKDSGDTVAVLLWIVAFLAALMFACPIVWKFLLARLSEVVAIIKGQ